MNMWYSEIPPHKEVRRNSGKHSSGGTWNITDTYRRYSQCRILGLNKGIRDGIAVAMATFSQNNVVPLITKVV